MPMERSAISHPKAMHWVASTKTWVKARPSLPRPINPFQMTMAKPGKPQMPPMTPPNTPTTHEDPG